MPELSINSDYKVEVAPGDAAYTVRVQDDLIIGVITVNRTYTLPRAATCRRDKQEKRVVNDPDSTAGALIQLVAASGDEIVGLSNIAVGQAARLISDGGNRWFVESAVEAAGAGTTAASTADSKAVSAGTRASVADSKAVSDSVNSSTADSKGASAGSAASSADSKAVSASANASTALSAGDSAGTRASVADSKAVSDSVNSSTADSKGVSAGSGASVADSKAVSHSTVESTNLSGTNSKVTSLSTNLSVTTSTANSG